MPFIRTVRSRRLFCATLVALSMVLLFALADTVFARAGGGGGFSSGGGGGGFSGGGSSSGGGNITFLVHLVVRYPRVGIPVVIIIVIFIIVLFSLFPAFAPRTAPRTAALPSSQWLEQPPQLEARRSPP